MAWLEHKDGAIYLHLRVSPGASRDAVEGLVLDAAGKEYLKIRVTAAPEKGKANAAVIKLLAKHWHIPKSSLEVVAGDTARNKVLRYTGDAEKLRLT